MDAYRLDNETALVTGGGTGLGLGIAQALVDAGARVIITGRRQGVLEAAAEQLGDRASWLVHDVTDMAAAPALVDEANRRAGPISIVVNNAGIHLKKPALDTTETEFLSVLNTHVNGAFALTRAAGQGMVERRHGAILFVASMASLFGIPYVAAYTAAKTAHVGLVRSLAVELSEHGVRVNAVAPGWIDSDMMRNALANDPEREAKILGRTPMRRFGTPQDIGRAAVFLCSPAAEFITGVVLPVDGGASVGF